MDGDLCVNLDVHVFDTFVYIYKITDSVIG